MGKENLSYWTVSWETCETKEERLVPDHQMHKKKSV